jgi:hypothetical protein
MNRRRTLGYLLVSALLLAIAGWHGARLVALRGKYRLDPADTLRNAPPSVVFTTVALGGFKGLIADVLWLRASHLQDRGEIFELVQLSDWITRLEPHCSEIWAFHAWNMAYNASAMVSLPEDRWRWVLSGIALLRDRGIRYNGGDPQLYFELGWLFMNKMGQAMDRDNMYFRKRWAEEMTAALGGPRPDYAALAAKPEMEARLERDYGLVPSVMRAMDRSYGPFDWRLPFSHSAYWAYRGRLAAGGTGSLACERMFYQSLVYAFFEGRLASRPADRPLVTSPDIAILPKAIRAFEEAASKRDEKTVLAAYRGFLRDSTLLLYAFGRRDEARANLELLLKRFPDSGDPGEIDKFAAANIGRAMGRAARNRIVAFTEGFFYQGFVLAATGESGKAAAAHSMAGQYWNACVSGKPPETLEKLGLPNIEEVRRNARSRAIEDLPPELAARIAGGEGEDP